MDSATPLPGERKVSVDQAFRLALEHHAGGRRSAAESLLKQVLQIAPGHAFAWQLMAVLAHEAGNTAEGISLLTKAIQANPLVSTFYANRGEMHRLVGNLDLAIADGEQAIRLDPKSAAAHSNLGIAFYDRGDMAQAEACQQQALKLDPNHLQALNNLGSIRRERKDRTGAIEMYRRAVDLNPNYAEAQNNLGAVMSEVDDAEGALKHLLAVVRARPNYAEAHCNIGNAFLALEDFARAETAFNQALRLRPEYPEACDGLARCAQERRNLDEALALAEKSIAMKPTRAAAFSLLGNIRSEQSFPEQALAAYDRALQIDPNLISALLGKGHLLMEMGRMKESEASFRHALELDPTSIAPRLSLTQVAKSKEGDENFEALLQASKDIDKMSESRAMSVHFALGKILEDVKRYDEAFPHYLEGCRLKRKRVQYSADNDDLILKNICETFTPDFVRRFEGAGDPSKLPIFVLGMPRSGTTLTETIIASHPQVHGAGELPDLLHLAALGNGANEIGFPLNMKDMSHGDFAAMGAKYVAQLQARAPEYDRITDKMPANFKAVGLIHLMLPNAKIVHIKRNAVDTCLSCFTRLFHRSQYQSYDLREIGRYYRNYLAVMEHWRQVLPAGSFYEIQYEQLVANQEAESRKLIEFCGLPWNDACLTPDKTERNVKTASVTQVRQPVYTSSVERWRVYEKFLGPLLEELGDAVNG